MAFMGVFELLTVVVLGGGLSLPVGLPPEPEDPVMSAVAPDECIAYLTWAGTATPDPNSENQVEQMLAEPEVQHFLRSVEGLILNAMTQWQEDSYSEEAWPEEDEAWDEGEEDFDFSEEVGPIDRPVEKKRTVPMPERDTAPSESTDELDDLFGGSKEEIAYDELEDIFGESEKPSDGGEEAPAGEFDDLFGEEPEAKEDATRPALGVIGEEPSSDAEAPPFADGGDAPTGGDPEKVMMQELPGLIKLLITSPAAAYLSELDVMDGGEPTIRAGAIVGFGDQLAAAKASLDKFVAMMPPGMARPIQVAGLPATVVEPEPGIPVAWMFKDDHFLVAIGDGELAAMIERMSTPAPDWLTSMREKLKVDRPSSFIYVDVAGAIDRITEAAGPEARTVVNALGLGDVQTLASVSGFGEEAMDNRTLLTFSREPSGIFPLIAGEPLSAEDLQPIPKDATLAMALRLDPNQVFDTVLSIAEDIEPRARAEMMEGVGEMNRELNIDLQDDILKSLGDRWCIYNSPGEGGLVFTGLTAVVNVRDSERLRRAHDRLLRRYRAETLDENGRPGRWDPVVNEIEFAGETIYFLSVPDDEFLFAPAWCLTDGELIGALFPQQIKTYLARDGNEEPLATLPAVASQFDDGAGPSLVAYQDTREMVKLIYPLAQFGLQFVFNEMDEEGFDADISMLPSAASILPHLTPSTGGIRRTENGIEIYGTSSVPMASSSGVVPFFLL